MFDNSDYSELDTKIKAWLPNIPANEVNEFANTISDNGDLMPQMDTENSLFLPEAPKVEKKSPVKPRFLAIFDCEEPHIKEDPETFSTCTQSKSTSTFDLRDDMEVAEEVVVTTEQDDSEVDLDSLLFGPPSYPADVKEEEVMSDAIEELSPASICSRMETSQGLYDLSPASQNRAPPHLRLDIDAAMVLAQEMFCGSLQDTPEVLKPVLKPTPGFDLVSFLLANGDSNNNTTPPANLNSREQERRRGKSHLSLSDLKECQKYGRGKPSPLAAVEESTEPTFPLELVEPTPGPSTITCSGRPARKSATKFKRLLEEGLLDSTLDSHSNSTDEDVSPPKNKRRRTSSSSSSRRRLNSESDQSSICDNVMKYRERRDRNNESSKRSRQKRKMQQELKKMELSELEAENKRLKRTSDKLAAALAKVHAAWKDYLIKMKKDN